MKSLLACLLWAIVVLCATSIATGSAGLDAFAVGVLAQPLAIILTIAAWRGRNREESA